MTVDTSRTITIAGSSLKMWGLFLLALVMTALSLALAVDLIPVHPSTASKASVFGWLGTVFFGGCAIIILGRAITNTGQVVTLSPTGIRDVRLAAKVVPWRGIRGISTWSHLGQHVMVLDVDPETEAGLHLSTIARWTRGANKRLGADGLCVTAQGLKISYAELLALATAYAADHGSDRRAV